MCDNMNLKPLAIVSRFITLIILACLILKLIIKNHWNHYIEFKQAIMKTDESTSMCDIKYKIVFLGDMGVGKTSIIERYVKD